MIRRRIRMRSGLALGAVALGVAGALSWTAAGAAPPTGAGDLPRFGPGSAYHPKIDPVDFGPNVDNPLFPLKPGTTLTYEGTKDGKKARNLFASTTQTKVVDGVTCRVVFDQLFLDGKLAERTYDYYAQDDHGNVWYFGEDTTKLDAQGNLTDTEGSFRAGVDGAQPGVFMPAQPVVGTKFRQEYYKGHAEDQFKVLSLAAPVTVPYGSFPNALKTEETTRLEHGVVDNKYYVSGIGEVEETSVKGPVEKLLLVDVKTS